MAGARLRRHVACVTPLRAARGYSAYRPVTVDLASLLAAIVQVTLNPAQNCLAAVFAGVLAVAIVVAGLKSLLFPGQLFLRNKRRAVLFLPFDLQPSHLVRLWVLFAVTDGGTVTHDFMLYKVSTRVAGLDVLISVVKIQRATIFLVAKIPKLLVGDDHARAYLTGCFRSTLIKGHLGVEFG